jgi:hypothetical protein
MQEHAEILGSTPAAHGALWRLSRPVLGENVTNWQRRAAGGALRGAPVV